MNKFDTRDPTVTYTVEIKPEYEPLFKRTGYKYYLNRTFEVIYDKNLGRYVCGKYNANFFFSDELEFLDNGA